MGLCSCRRRASTTEADDALSGDDDGDESSPSAAVDADGVRRRRPGRASSPVGRRGSSAGEALFAGRGAAEPSTDEDKAVASERCLRCRLACSRVALETIHGKNTIGQLRDYVKDMEDREAMLNGFEGAEDRQREGLAGN
mmetsp:Transcript_9967/g.28341  ORF Transcript_9967/g.28341 Transcript_9967/m.28341 type:complete len:140 (-) Transcript_9967:120-539(-)